MTTASIISSTPTVSRTEMWTAFDKLPSKVRDALNYARFGYPREDIILLYKMYDEGVKTADDLVYMIEAKDNFMSVFGGWLKNGQRGSFDR